MSCTFKQGYHGIFSVLWFDYLFICRIIKVSKEKRTKHKQESNYFHASKITFLDCFDTFAWNWEISVEYYDQTIDFLDIQ